MKSIDQALREAGAAAYVIYASSRDADMRYLTGFRTGDPLLYIKKPGEDGTLIVPQMEYDRAVSEASCNVMTRAEAGFFDIFKEEKDYRRATARMVARHAGGDILVPSSFPLGFARSLETCCKVHLDTGTVEKQREIKDEKEIACIQHSQQINEKALALAHDMIRQATVKDGLLYHDNEPLTSDLVRQEMHCFFLRNGMRGEETIVSCGEETSMPHCQGNGILRENEPILIDVFPQDEKTGYFADMTRTVVRGEPEPEIEGIYNIVLEAKEMAKAMVAPGITGAAVHQAVVDLFDESGYKTDTQGFIHSLGHGVGLDIHEGPAVSPSGGPLERGNVITIEPGLYYRGCGGVRLEDMGVVTQKGLLCFTTYRDELRL